MRKARKGPENPSMSLKGTTMNRKLATALFTLAAVAGGNAFAESPLAGGADHFAGGKTRAEVQAELQAYKQAGVNPWSTSYNPLRGFTSAKSRAQVAGEYISARDQVAAFTSEDSGSAWLQAAQRNTLSDTLAGTPRNAQ
jgi:hypothetical protein